MKLLVALLLNFILSVAICAELPKPPQAIIRSHYRLVVECHKKVADLIHVYWIEPVGTATGIGKRQLICCAHEIQEEVPPLKYFLDIYDDDGVSKKRLSVQIGKISKEKDLCLLSVEEDLLSFVDVQKNKGVQIGDWVYCIGSKVGKVPFAISWGSFAAKKFEEAPSLNASSMAVFGGNSGGGLYEAEGHTLIGLIQSGYSGPQGCAFGLSIPIETIRGWLAEK